MLFLTLMAFLLTKIIKNEKNAKAKVKPNYLKFNFNTKIRSIERNMFNSLYNETKFLKDFLNNTIFLDLNMGTPKQNIKIMMEPYDVCFNFINNKELIKLNQHYKENNHIKFIPYHKNISSSHKKKKLINSVDKIESHEEAFYLFQFRDDATNKKNDFYNESTSLTFSYQNEINEDILYGKFGLNMNDYKDIDCQGFIPNLKNKNILKKYIWFFRFYSRFDGYFYMGPEPHLYYIENSIYKEYQYVKTNNIISKEGYNHWTLLFDQITIKKLANANQYYLNDKMALIEFNSGLIIGTYEYQQMIEKLFFKMLIDKNICQKSFVNYFFHNSIQKYYVYKCKETINQRINETSYLSYIDFFPELNFYSNSFEYSFKLSKNDLFEQINRIIYFLVIFDGNNKINTWKLGQIFLKRHTLIFDYESKVIGFYDRNIKQDFVNKKPDNRTNNSNQKNNTLNIIFINCIKIIFFCVIIGIAILLG